MHIRYGDRKPNQPFRCLFCTKLKPRNGEPSAAESDPVCEQFSIPTRTHSWVHAANGLTDYWRVVIREFWKREVKDTPLSDLTSPEKMALKMKLEEKLRKLQDDVAWEYGVQATLLFVKPKRQ